MSKLLAQPRVKEAQVSSLSITIPYMLAAAGVEELAEGKLGEGKVVTPSLWKEAEPRSLQWLNCLLECMREREML